jgi:hypothetical protein
MADRGVSLLFESKEENLARITIEVLAEVKRACAFHDGMHGPHEAYGVILEELDEYWDEVKLYNPRKGRDTRSRQREELIQLAAMAIRAISDTIDFGKHYEAAPCNPSSN